MSYTAIRLYWQSHLCTIVKISDTIARIPPLLADADQLMEYLILTTI